MRWRKSESWKWKWETNGQGPKKWWDGAQKTEPAAILEGKWNWKSCNGWFLFIAAEDSLNY